MTLDSWVDEIEKINQAHGWDFEPEQLPEKIALMHSELSEALEEFRKGHPFNHIYYSTGVKPEGIAVEMIDCVIRIMHFFAKSGLSMNEVMQMKVDYNRTRPYRHGKVV